jgi:four helix bundle protein
VVRCAINLQISQKVISLKMDNKQFARELETRTLKYAIRIIRPSAKLPNTPEGRVVRNQITKAGTSVGVNYREANRARSRADFKNKISICESESSETQYWLEVIKELQWLPSEELKDDYEECSELLAIFTTIGKKK